jgi:hypothetical protein
MKRFRKGTIGFSSVQNATVGFDGIFQCRLSTNSDPSDEPRGHDGWTFAYENEPDLDKIIRFNNPLVPRSFSDRVGVSIKYININGNQINDPMLGQMINLNEKSYFDGRRNRPGTEPIANFEIHVGNNVNYIFGQSNKPPAGTGIREISPAAKALLGLETEEKFGDLKNKRIEQLQSSANTVEQKRLENIDQSLTYYFMTRVVSYSCNIDKNLILDPKDSSFIKTLKEKDIKDTHFNADFYSFDGDALVGKVAGSISFTFI